MPRVQYSCPPKGINECRRMDSPKSVGKTEAWLKEAFKAFPEAPQNYTLRHTITSLNVICFEFVSNRHEKFALVLDRKAS